MAEPVIIDVEWREIKKDEPPLKVDETGQIKKKLSCFDFVIRTAVILEVMYVLIRFSIGLYQNYQYWSTQTDEVTIRMIVTGMP